MAQINKPTDYFNTVLYTGNSSTNAITGVGFQPDWVWLKDRDNANSHKLYDGVRGTTKYIISSNTSAEATQANGLTSFDNDGFTLGSYAGTNGSGGGSGPNFVSWNWLAGGSAVSNSDGSITSTVSANTTSGFSIVSFTGTQTLGATVGHGLGAVPKVIIIKDRDNVRNWNVYHASVCDSDNKFLRINTTDAVITGGATHFDISAMSSTVFGLGADNESNPIASAIAYCFAEKKGFSKFGSYIANGSTDGPFVYTGFKPAYVLVKRTDSSTESYWSQIDNKRDTYNVAQKRLNLNIDSSENSDPNHAKDFLSNGFKIRSSHPINNASGGTYIYMAFAEQPLVGTNNIPATAR